MANDKQDKKADKTDKKVEEKVKKGPFQDVVDDEFEDFPADGAYA